LSFFKTLNTYYDQAAATWLRNHQGRAITELEIGDLFGTAYGKAATISNAESGFRKSGIFPFDRNLFTDEDFLSSKMTDRPLNSHPDGQLSDAEPSTSSETDVTGDKAVSSDVPGSVSLEDDNEPNVPSASPVGSVPNEQPSGAEPAQAISSELTSPVVMSPTVQSDNRATYSPAVTILLCFDAYFYLLTVRFVYVYRKQFVCFDFIIKKNF